MKNKKTKAKVITTNQFQKLSKIEFLCAISTVIEELLRDLYPIEEQICFLNSCDKNFMVSLDTYSKFLNKYMEADYILHRKNILFAKNVFKIRDVISLYPEDPTLQFEKLKFDAKDEVTLIDYNYFFINYYVKYSEEFFRNQP